MSKFNPPNALAFEGNTAENWTKFKKEFQFYMSATESNSKPKDVTTSRLLTYIGEKTRDASYIFTFVVEDDAMKLQPVIDKFNEHLNPKKNVTFLPFKIL